MRHYEGNNRPNNTSFIPEVRFMFANTPKGKVGSIKESSIPVNKDYTNALFRAPKDFPPNNSEFVFKSARLFMVTDTEYIYAVTLEIPKELVLFIGDDEPIAGIATGGLFASSKYLERSDNSSKWMHEVCGSSFGWIEASNGMRWTNDKRYFRAPTAQEYVDLFLPLF